MLIKCSQNLYASNSEIYFVQFIMMVFFFLPKREFNVFAVFHEFRWMVWFVDYLKIQYLNENFWFAMSFYGITSCIFLHKPFQSFQSFQSMPDEYSNMPLFIYCSIQIENYFDATKRKEAQPIKTVSNSIIFACGNVNFVCGCESGTTRWLVMLYEAVCINIRMPIFFRKFVVSFRFVCSALVCSSLFQENRCPLPNRSILGYNGSNSICIGIHELRKCCALNRIFGSSGRTRLCRTTSVQAFSNIAFIHHRFMIFIQARSGPFRLLTHQIYNLWAFSLMHILFFVFGGDPFCICIHAGIETGFALSIPSVYLAVRLKYTVYAAKWAASSPYILSYDEEEEEVEEKGKKMIEK